MPKYLVIQRRSWSSLGMQYSSKVNRRAAFVAGISTLPSTPLPVAFCSQSPFVGATVAPRRRCSSMTTSASLLDDFLAGPSSPPRPRPLSQVVTFSLATGLLYYGVYKFIVEEDLRSSGVGGKGGVVALGPFVAGTAAPLLLPPTPGYACFAAGLAWILYVQFTLHQRTNALCAENGLGEPLELWWTFVPPFNILVGLRGIHYLSKVYGGGDDPLANVLPWVTMPKVDAVKLVVTPELWLKL